MSTTVSIRCPQCGTITYNSDYCSNCGNIINTQLKRKRAQEEKTQQRLQEEREKKPSRWKTFTNMALEHPNMVVKFLARSIYAVWAFIGMLIGGLIAIIIGIASG